MRRCRSARPLLGGSSRPRSHRPHADEDPDQAAWSWRLASPPAATLNQNSTTLGIPTDSVGAEFALDRGLLDDAVALGGAVDGRPGTRLPGIVGGLVAVVGAVALLAAARHQVQEAGVGVLAADHPEALHRPR